LYKSRQFKHGTPQRAIGQSDFALEPALSGLFGKRKATMAEINRSKTGLVKPFKKNEL
jgi:hypothetical protein